MKFGALRRWSAIAWTQVMESALIRGRTFNDSMSLLLVKDRLTGVALRQLSCDTVFHI